MIPATSGLARRPDAYDPLAHPAAVRSRLWLEFVNTDVNTQNPRGDLLRAFESLLAWLADRGAIDEERAAGIARRTSLQPAAAAASLVDARRVRAALRALAERGAASQRIQDDAVVEINRVLGRSAGTRRVDRHADGSLVRAFVPTGDAFAGLMIPIVESAADSLVADELVRVRRCANPSCQRVFYDATRNGLRRWCDMGLCGNRAKAARHRARSRLRPLQEHDAQEHDGQEHDAQEQHELRDQ